MTEQPRMAQQRESTFPTSPRSSPGGADSYKHEGTPDTRLTAFSPEESIKSNKLAKALGLTPARPQPIHFPVSTFGSTSYAQGKDPFVTSTPTTKHDQKLSATASAFQPTSTSLVSRVPGASLPIDAPGYDTFENVPTRLSTDLHLSRCLLVSSNTSDPVVATDVINVLTNIETLGPWHGEKYLKAIGDRVYIRCTNIADACTIFRAIKNSIPAWSVEYISPVELGQVLNQPLEHVSSYEGQIQILIVPSAPGDGSNLDIPGMLPTLCHLFQSEGELFACRRQLGEDDALRFILEFCDCNLANVVVSKYQPGQTFFVGKPMVITHHRPIEQAPKGPMRATSVSDLTSAFANFSIPKTEHTMGPVHGMPMPGMGGHMPIASAAGLGMALPPQLPMSPLMYPSPFVGSASYLINPIGGIPALNRSHSITGIPNDRTSNAMSFYTTSGPMVRVQNNCGSPRPLQHYNRSDGRRQNAMRVQRAPYYSAAGHHNHVDTQRIRDGIDVRTTIMLRNIPNKVDQAMLKGIVDESSKGKYDFMYLRIDFANDCNVGYAFINFVDPLDIIRFVEVRGNQRWNCFKSDKVAEISYATIQGKDCLVQKFRNSSVMLEAPHYRPKLYYTTNGPLPRLAGQEEPFPPPDNQSKMKRSCENAEHVGLFTPNAGQHLRDEQRRRRSQYDRGTRLAALEEYDMETVYQSLYSQQ